MEFKLILIFLNFFLIPSFDCLTTCGEQVIKPGREDRVVGGEETYLGEFPWQVLVVNRHNLKCAAVLIADSWALSVAHCFEDAQMENINLRFGVHNFKVLRFRDLPVERNSIQKFDHPNYKDVKTGSDITLLKFKSVEFKPHIRPICLPYHREDADASGKLFAFIGWGQIYDKDWHPATLQKVDLPVIDNDACERIDATVLKIKTNLNEKFICAGYKTGRRSTCSGDAGGPLQAQRKDGTWYVIGLLSLGYPKCNGPDLFTNVSHYIPWIRRTMNNS